MENEETNTNKEAKKKRFETEIEKAEWRLKTVADCKEAMLSNEKVKKMYANYSKHSVDSFVEHYVREKIQTLEWGEKHIEWRNKRIEKWLETAVEKLREIQQKKLFDLQCQWRANKISIKGITLSTDFLDWEMDIFNCPFIEAISENDLQLYMEYLQSDDYYEKLMFDFSLWQHYDWIKDAYDNEESEHLYPPWYAFHDIRRGSSVYLSFPNIRGEKEEFYLRLGEAEYQKENSEKIKQELVEHQQTLATMDRRKDLDYLKSNFFTWFVEKFEDDETKEVFNISGKRFVNDDDELDINDWGAKQLLEEAEENVPVKESKDWKEAIELAAWNYSKKKISEAIPEAYEQYKLMEEMGWGGSDIFGQMMKMENQKIKEEKILLIKRGRVLNGEPGDLNF